MDIASQIADILQSNPNGLKASELAREIGCSRKEVNSYLYSHQDLYQQHEGFVWRNKTIPKRIYEKQTQTSHYSGDSNQVFAVNFQQYSEGQPVSVLTITPNNAGYKINSTNNLVICCDCGKFYSIHAYACPFCGCPTHVVADIYYKKYSVDIIKEQKLKKDQEERQYKRKALAILQSRSPFWRTKYPQVEALELEQFKTAIGRANELLDNARILPQIPDDEWYFLLTADKVEYNLKLNALKDLHKRRMLIKQRLSESYLYYTQEKVLEQIEGTAFEIALERAVFLQRNERKLPYLSIKEWHVLLTSDKDSYNIQLQSLFKKQKETNTREVSSFCEVNGITKSTCDSLLAENIKLQEVITRLQYVKYCEKEYAHKRLCLTDLIVYPIEEIKKTVKTMVD